MSTAGKVLIVLILLSTIMWAVLTSGVDQYNRNGNKAMKELNEKVIALEDQLRKTQVEIADTKDQTTVLQEQMDAGLSVIYSRQNDVQRSASSVREILSRVQYELATVQATVQGAEQERKERYAEKDAETKALEQARAEVKVLQTKDSELREQLQKLRDEFKLTLKTNTERLSPR